MDMLKIVEDFIDDYSIDMVISYLDNNEEDLTYNPDIFQYGLKLGRDMYHGKESILDASRLKEIRSYVLDIYLPKCIDTVSTLYGDDSDLFIASVWIMRAKNGSYISKHNDQDHGANKHLKWSIVTYLNNMPDNDGSLNFFNMDYSYSPKKGETVIFPSAPPKYNHQVKSINNDRYTIVAWLTNDPEFDLMRLIK